MLAAGWTREVGRGAAAGRRNRSLRFHGFVQTKFLKYQMLNVCAMQIFVN